MNFQPIQNIATHTLFSTELPNNLAELLREYILDRELCTDCVDGDFSYQTSYKDLIKILTEFDDNDEDVDFIHTYTYELEIAFPSEWKNDRNFMLWFIH